MFSEDAMIKAAEQAATIREWMKQPGAQLVLAEMDRLAGKMNNRWLLANEEEAAAIRAEARPYAYFISTIKKFLQEGNQAAAELNRRKEFEAQAPAEGGQG